MKRTGMLGAIAAGAAVWSYAAYRRDMTDARLRTRSGRRVIESPEGPIEFAQSGHGPAVLVVHGAGGGFDQGLRQGTALVGDGYRLIAPSRFGYLGTPLPRDASPQAQADAFVSVLDALRVDAVPVIGMSAGAPSAMQFCLRHPDRCTALILIVPLAYSPDGVTERARVSREADALMKAFLSSDLLFWLATKVARTAVVTKILGTPAEVYLAAPPQVRKSLDRTLDDILPISERAAGLWNEGVVGASLERYALEDIHVPALIVSAEDDGYRTYAGARYTAEQIGAEFVGFPSGGHLLAGHDEAVRSKVCAFLTRVAAAGNEKERKIGA